MFFQQVVTTTTSNLERIRQPPFVTRPITNHQSDLLRILLENLRQHVESQPRPNPNVISHQNKPQHKKTSDSTESAAQQGSLSSDSSDES